MNTVSQVMTALKQKGSAQTRKTFARHGAPEAMFGVKVADLKTIAKKIKGQQALAYALYESGNSDAMYLAGIVADGSQMTRKQLESWVKGATWYMLSEYTVPWVATESPYARDLALKWIDSKKQSIASSGWCTYAGIVAVTPDEALDLAEVKQLLERVVKQIDTAPNRVRYTMNGFVIAVGAYVKPLLKQAKAAAKKIGTVSVDMGDTACKVPRALEYIEKIEKSGRVGKKRKTIKC
jgi:3-methyladenine DNA glycosylase AlkD